MPHNIAVRVTSLDKSLVDDGFKNLEITQRLMSAGPHIGRARPWPGRGAGTHMKLRPVNPTDLLKSSGFYGKLSLPAPIGSEGVAVVEKNGPGASKFRPGTRVVGGGWGVGTWQQFLVVKETQLLAVSESLDDKTAAGFFINPVTVVGLVEISDVPKGKYLLQGAAASVLGRQLVQYAKHVGVKTINVVRRSEHIQELKDLGADEVINSSEEDIVKRVQEITGNEGAWAAVDPVAGDFTSQALRSLRQGGWVRVYGALSGGALNVTVSDFLASGRKLTGFIMPQWLEEGDGARKQERLQAVMKLLEDKVITPLSGRTFELEQVHEAIAASQKAGRGAKIFLSG